MQQRTVLLSLIAASAAAVALTRRFVGAWDKGRAVHAVIEALPNPIYFKQADGRYGAVNSAWESFFSVPRGAVIGRSAHELGLPERAIIEALEAWSLSQDVTEMQLEVYAENVAARNAYAKSGYHALILTMRKGL